MMLTKEQIEYYFINVVKVEFDGINNEINIDDIEQFLIIKRNDTSIISGVKYKIIYQNLDRYNVANRENIERYFKIKEILE